MVSLTRFEQIFFLINDEEYPEVKVYKAIHTLIANQYIDIVELPDGIIIDLDDLTREFYSLIIQDKNYWSECEE